MNSAVPQRTPAPLTLGSRLMHSLRGHQSTHTAPAPIAERSIFTSPLPSAPTIEVRGPSFDGGFPKSSIPTSPTLLSPASLFARRRSVVSSSQRGFGQQWKAHSIVLAIDTPQKKLSSSSLHTVPTEPISFLDLDGDDDDNGDDEEVEEKFEGELEVDDVGDEWTLSSASSQELRTPPLDDHDPHPSISDFNDTGYLYTDVEDLLEEIGWQFPRESVDRCEPAVSDNSTLPLAPSPQPPPKPHFDASLALALEEESHVHLKIRASVYDPFLHGTSLFPILDSFPTLLTPLCAPETTRKGAGYI